MHTSGISQHILVTGRAHFENELVKEATWVSHSHPHHVHFASNPQVGFTSTPSKYPEEQRLQARSNPVTYVLD